MQTECPTMSAEITFLKPEEGGRSTLPLVHYTPHLVVEMDGNAESEYLGVRFVGIPEKAVLGEPGLYELTLMYDQVDYSALQVGAVFTVREGPHIAGHGRVIRGLIAES